MKHLFWWWHVWLCISDSHCTSMADLRLITVCINRENKCHHVLVSQNLAGFQPPSLSCQKKSGNCFSPFCKVVSIDCILILFVFFFKTGFLRSHQAGGKAWGLLDISPGTHYTASVATFFISSIFSPLFLHISPGTHSAASVSALVKTKTNFTQTFYNFAVCDL